MLDKPARLGSRDVLVHELYVSRLDRSGGDVAVVERIEARGENPIRNEEQLKVLQEAEKELHERPRNNG